MDSGSIAPTCDLKSCSSYLASSTCPGRYHTLETYIKVIVAYLLRQPKPLRRSSAPICPHRPPNLWYAWRRWRSSSGVQSPFFKEGSKASRYLLEQASSVLPGMCLAMTDHLVECIAYKDNRSSSSSRVQAVFFTVGHKEWSHRFWDGRICYQLRT